MSHNDYAADLRADDAADQNEAYQQAIRRAIRGWFESLEASGECDHSVGICMCGEIREFLNAVHVLIPGDDELVMKYERFFGWDNVGIADDDYA